MLSVSKLKALLSNDINTEQLWIVYIPNVYFQDEYSLSFGRQLLSPTPA